MTTWFVTGASRGFGRTLTELLLDRGDRVAATLRSPTHLDDLAAVHGDRLWVRALDVTDTASLRTVVDAAFAALGRIDVVVSNAGYGVFGAAEELTDTDVEGLIATNLTGSIQLARIVTPHLRAQGGGHLMQLSSMGGHLGFPGFALYHAGKWGIEGFYEAFAREVEPFGIRTTLVEPGMIRTSFYDAAGRASALPAYAANPAISRGTIPVEDMPGDETAVVRAMIEAADSPAPARRLVLGSDAYRLMHAAMAERLAEVEAQADVAGRTDIAPAPAVR
jgi:NAD(P)-dependent dehydrogenase (short-subunit alcohol dehydrogenase family)